MTQGILYIYAVQKISQKNILVIPIDTNYGTLRHI